MNERGQVVIMVVGLALVCFAIAGIAIDGTRAFLFRRTLQNGADSSALAGAAELDVGSLRAADTGVTVARKAADVAARDYVARRGLDVAASIDVTPSYVRVLLIGEIGTGFLALVGIDSLPVSAVARATPLTGAP